MAHQENLQLKPMTEEQLNWKESKKHISEYAVTKLPRGTEESHAEFVPIKFQTQARRGPKTKTDAEILAEQVQDFKKKELKLETAIITD